MISAFDGSITVEYSQFLLGEFPLDRDPLTLTAPAGEWIAVGGAGGLLLHSAANDHYPAVRVELWDSDPGAASGEWDHVLVLDCDLREQVRLRSVTSDMEPQVLHIPSSGAHRVRVHTGGRAAAAELDEGTFEEGVECWLFQLWPA
ncbi:hypothetical protein D5S17_04970 [Pseudonocardiaceae bacterium YIM PH 21723]|nr:hypothetical protein D5S17_04970 [Pseudonocardiaceae bacterium YIM PH 21723]